MLGDLGPRVLHTVGTFWGSMAESLASVGWLRIGPWGHTAWVLHPILYHHGRVTITVALPHGVATKVQ